MRKLLSKVEEKSIASLKNLGYIREVKEVPKRTEKKTRLLKISN